MPELHFEVTDVVADTQSVAPLLVFKLRIVNVSPTDAVRNVMLQCQLRIDATQRRYELAEQERLAELFGTADRWGQTLGSLLWTQVSLVVPAFTTACLADLPVPCSFDFNVAATKYFHGLERGEVPISLLMSGSVFYTDVNGDLQVAPIAWSKEAHTRLPLQVWKAMMDRHYPDSAWLRLSREAFDSLYRYKRHQGLATWDQTLIHLLAKETAT